MIKFFPILLLSGLVISTIAYSSCNNASITKTVSPDSVVVSKTYLDSLKKSSDSLNKYIALLDTILTLMVKETSSKEDPGKYRPILLDTTWWFNYHVEKK